MFWVFYKGKMVETILIGELVRYPTITLLSGVDIDKKNDEVIRKLLQTIIGIK